ncbi:MULTISPECIES: pyridoxamine 5'-phosphate oxidase family protein [Mycolicibacterium]|jgi:predicted pyridoxine 5'-phosphate oxidase superfamily flavin-nucleotide-binding protein|uniref:Pyridoxamine 5'-phosphate oxidase-related, FMN-binding protein n=1 Tax=Mycolicibacterium vanbaalenii (strain DSM 7251 / JCM 13017 / BCRC 16820 / KCTC 9966 / NRRL B-24157 / PYR-1) TaxID=350058 RepID=A1TEA5_MYCVP|nr:MULTISPECIES: pyridoxamine 5'-phosphate oxidase family protein [Mycolicibacterium]ABM15505.1 pyridoxamine 5'-phosphate oxidase-related, FMN-binding protein [Mycolicibacterium vanbaalenii PYR-1]MDW5614973.1 pyridoxamine 5'-phosphate oxidase family protein [Mycolicibacterium sp. D5.8-2]PQP51238.1 pyridoxamine 5-phosphate oxidase [Mycolicibacterium austroafricanum]QZT55886.1 pyridoxamine 5'-phosphate oxidase family protein [Mycolicibacterium austroafricanum]
MSKHYGSIAFTGDVRAVQSEHGSEAFYGRKLAAGKASSGRDPLTGEEKEYLSERDGLFLASVGETGWPYVQFRGGPRGFVRVLDDHTIGWADFRGNLQYISTGNVNGDDRVAIIAVDYAQRRRLKIFGHARIVTAEQDAALIQSLSDSTYDAVVERAVVVGVDAYDWNCPQHITPRFTLEELEPALAPLRSELSSLQAENARLREQLERAGA